MHLLPRPGVKGKSQVTDRYIKYGRIGVWAGGGGTGPLKIFMLGQKSMRHSGKT
jgi:hypothetical protein